MKLLIATRNPGKFEEIRAMLGSLEDQGFEFVSLKELGIEAEFEEIGETFESNALGKARFYAQLSGLPTVSDDSGLRVEALVGELGVKTRRWGAGEQASDQEWLDHFMNRMTCESNRAAEFICVAAYVNEEEERSFFGETKGFITEKIEADVKPGIPLSSVFCPEGYARVYSALSLAEKNRLSHRGKAFEALRLHLQKL